MLKPRSDIDALMAELSPYWSASLCYVDEDEVKELVANALNKAYFAGTQDGYKQKETEYELER